MMKVKLTEDGIVGYEKAANNRTNVAFEIPKEIFVKAFEKFVLKETTPNKVEGFSVDNIPSNIEMLIKSHGYSQHNLASKMGINDALVSRWINGSRTPTVVQLCMMAEIFECSLDEFVKGE